MTFHLPNSSNSSAPDGLRGSALGVALGQGPPGMEARMGDVVEGVTAEPTLALARMEPLPSEPDDDGDEAPPALRPTELLRRRLERLG